VCVIVDANLTATFFNNPFAGDYAPVVRWITERDGRLVYGGKLKAELEKSVAARRLLLAWWRAGRAHLVEDAPLASEEAVVASLGHCQSNDAHVVALARVSGARVLCTDDQPLMRDLRDQRLIARPRGKIHRERTHAHLLAHASSCGVRPLSPRRRGKS